MLGRLGDLNLSIPELVEMGYFPGAKPWTKFGVGNVTTAWSTVFSAGADPGLYIYHLDITPATISVASDDTDDDDGGTGCELVQITGLDANLDEQEEIIVMNGQSPASGSKIFRRIHRIENVSEQDAQGQIYVGTSTGGWTLGVPNEILGHLDNGYNQSQMVLYTVPRGYRLMFFNGQATTAGKAGEFGFYIRSHGHGATPKTVFANKVPYFIDGFVAIDSQRVPFVLPYGAEFEVRARADSASMFIAVNLNGVLMPERYFQK